MEGDAPVDDVDVGHARTEVDSGTPPLAHTPVNAQTLTAHSEAGGDVTAPGHANARTHEERRPTTIGRYRVIRRLGAGGMGVVYAAHDPDLGRTVAIKLVREPFGGGAALQERLRREAQALARLHHPNVVSVHDVGVSDGQLYIVMQYVDGAALDAWIEANKPDRAGVIALFVQAGRGLAVAHAAGLVHRDFKPANVLVESDGTVRVTDFGLARLSHLSDAPIGDSNDELVEMTHGDVVGTPAYMAPEQFLGGAITAATDQFGFCVSLWQELAGKRPFAGKTFNEIRNAVVTGAIEPAPRAIPRRIQRALRRGLSVRAPERFPDMDALLRQLAPPRRVWLAVVASVAMIGGGALAATLLTASSAATPCRGTDAAMAEVWAPARAQAVRAAVAALGTPDAPAMADAAVAALEARSNSWRTMRRDTCEATKVRHDEDDTVMGRRVACLDRSLEGMRSAVDLLTGDASPAVRANALAIARSGTDPADCTAAGTIGAAPPAALPPELARQLADLDTHGEAGNDAYVLTEGPKLAAALEAAGANDEAAQAWYHVAKAGTGLPSSDATDAARKAAQLASQGGDDDLSAKAWAIAAQRASDSGDLDGVDDFLTLATASAAKSPHPMTRMLVDISRAWVEKHRTHNDAAEALCKKVYDDAKTAYGSESEPVLAALGCLFNVAYQRNDFDAAGRYADERVATVTKAYGADSSEYLDAAIDAAMVVTWKDPAAGAQQFQTLIARETQVYGADSVTVMESWYELGNTASQDGSVATPTALDASKHASEIAMRILPADDLKRARVVGSRADILADAGDTADASALYEQVLAAYDKIKNPHIWAPVAYNAADLYRRAGQCARATPLLARLVQYADAGQLDRNMGATSRGSLGACEVVSGQYDDGVAKLEAACVDLAALGADGFLAEFRLELADAYWKHGDRADARTVAQAVMDSAKGDDSWQPEARREAARYLKP